MKLIISILLLVVGSFAQNTTYYMDGSKCECDSISTHVEHPFIYQTAYFNGNRIQEKLFSISYGVNKSSTSYVMITESNYKNDKITDYTLYDLLGNIKGEIYYSDDGYLEIAHLNKGNSVFMNKKDGLLNGITTWIKSGGIEVGRAEFIHGSLVGYKHCSDGRFGNETLDCLN